jgi:hypothetical protein
MRDIPDNGLATFIHRHVFDDDALLALAAIPLEGFDLRRESSGKLVQGSFVNVHLFQSSGSLKAARLRHRRHVNSVAVIIQSCPPNVAGPEHHLDRTMLECARGDDLPICVPAFG